MARTRRREGKSISQSFISCSIRFVLPYFIINPAVRFKLHRTSTSFANSYLGIPATRHSRKYPNALPSFRRIPRTRFQSRPHLWCLAWRMSNKVQGGQEGHDERSHLGQESSSRKR